MIESGCIELQNATGQTLEDWKQAGGHTVNPNPVKEIRGVYLRVSFTALTTTTTGGSASAAAAAAAAAATDPVIAAFAPTAFAPLVVPLNQDGTVASLGDVGQGLVIEINPAFFMGLTETAGWHLNTQSTGTGIPFPPENVVTAVAAAAIHEDVDDDEAYTGIIIIGSKKRTRSLPPHTYYPDTIAWRLSREESLAIPNNELVWYTEIPITAIINMFITPNTKGEDMHRFFEGIYQSTKEDAIVTKVREMITRFPGLASVIAAADNGIYGIGAAPPQHSDVSMRFIKDSRLAAPGTQFNISDGTKFSTIERLGAGTYGAVYLVTRESDKKQMVMKFDNRATGGRNPYTTDVKKEIEAYRRMTVPLDLVAPFREAHGGFLGVAEMLAYDDAGGPRQPQLARIFLTYFPKTLGNMLRAKEVISVQNMARDILTGLEFLHVWLKVAHCDMSLGNVCADHHGRFHLVDAGSWSKPKRFDARADAPTRMQQYWDPYNGDGEFVDADGFLYRRNGSGPTDPPEDLRVTFKGKLPEDGSKFIGTIYVSGYDAQAIGAASYRGDIESLGYLMLCVTYGTTHLPWYDESINESHNPAASHSTYRRAFAIKARYNQQHRYRAADQASMLLNIWDLIGLCAVRSPFPDDLEVNKRIARVLESAYRMSFWDIPDYSTLKAIMNHSTA